MSFPEVSSDIMDEFIFLKRLGKGAYGIVWLAKNIKTGEKVAIKKIFDAFRNETDAQRTIREICYLKEFKNHENIIKLISIKRSRCDDDIYLIFEYFKNDLFKLIQHHEGLHSKQKQFIIYQILKAIKYIHSSNVIHRDLKPSNILVNENFEIKICDFGLSRSLNSVELDANNPTLTDYVATRWYRAPEILIGTENYGKEIDMWSLGCILSEIVIERPLFPGTSTINQLELIAAIIPISVEEFDHSIKSSAFRSIFSTFSKPIDYHTINNTFPSNVDMKLLNLIKGLLFFSPSKRLNILEAINHPYLQYYHNDQTEPTLNYHIKPPIDDNVRFGVDVYRTMIYDDIKLNNLKCSRTINVLNKNNHSRNYNNYEPSLTRNEYYNNKNKNKYIHSNLNLIGRMNKNYSQQALYEEESTKFKESAYNFKPSKQKSLNSFAPHKNDLDNHSDLSSRSSKSSLSSDQHDNHEKLSSRSYIEHKEKPKGEYHTKNPTHKTIISSSTPINSSGSNSVLEMNNSFETFSMGYKKKKDDSSDESFEAYHSGHETKETKNSKNNAADDISNKLLDNFKNRWKLSKVNNISTFDNEIIKKKDLKKMSNKNKTFDNY